MRSEPDIRLNVSRSALAGYFSWLAGALTAAAAWLCLAAVGFAPLVAICVGIVCGLLSFWWLRRAGQLSEPVELIFRAAGGCWLVPIQALADAQTAELPALVAYQNYFGLHYLENHAKQSVLLWPDQLDAESARRLRIWLKAQIRK